jgi:hypothetical protein
MVVETRAQAKARLEAEERERQRQQRHQQQRRRPQQQQQQQQRQGAEERKEEVEEQQQPRRPSTAGRQRRPDPVLADRARAASAAAAATPAAPATAGVRGLCIGISLNPTDYKEPRSAVRASGPAQPRDAPGALQGIREDVKVGGSFVCVCVYGVCVCGGGGQIERGLDPHAWMDAWVRWGQSCSVCFRRGLRLVKMPCCCCCCCCHTCTHSSPYLTTHI